MNKLRLALMGVLPLAVIALGGVVAKALIDSYEAPVPEPVVIEPPLVEVIAAERLRQTLRG